MSFRCDRCNEPQGNKSQPTRVVTRTREKTYNHTDENGKPFTRKGWEIAAEQNLCSKCAGGRG